jgi:hypothetical protein
VKLGINLALVFVSLVVCLAITELGLRLVGFSYPTFQVSDETVGRCFAQMLRVGIAKKVKPL